MAVLAVLSTRNTEGAPDSAPRRIVSELPAVRIEVVQFERNGGAAVPYFRMQGESTTEFESVLADDPKISDVKRLERTDNGGLYKTVWDVDSPLIHCMATTNGVIVQAQGTVDEWHLKIWFESGSDASTFQQCCHTRDVPLEVDRLTSLAETLSDVPADVSPRQHEALILAYRRGYFDDPRRVSQEELAEELGISAPAVGRRLHRGYRNLIEETLLE